MSRKMTEQELNLKYQTVDPWGYRTNTADYIRRDKIVKVVGKTERLIDLGCGEGFITEALDAESIVAVDICQKALDRCHFDGEKFCGDAYKGIPFSFGQFDTVLTTGLLYGAETYDIDVISNLVKSGGRFISCHLQGRPYCVEYLKALRGWTVEHYEEFQYREFIEELLVVRHDIPVS